MGNLSVFLYLNAGGKWGPVVYNSPATHSIRLGTSFLGTTPFRIFHRMQSGWWDGMRGGRLVEWVYGRAKILVQFGSICLERTQPLLGPDQEAWTLKTCSVGGIRAGACFLFRFILAIFTLLSPILLTALGDMLGAGLMLQHGPLDLNSFADYITPCDSITDLHTSSCPFLFFCLILVILSSHQLSREILWASPWNSNAPRWIVRPLSHTWRASNEMPSARN